jgi:hypothetical protein
MSEKPPPGMPIQAISIGDPVAVDSLAEFLLANYAPKTRLVLRLVTDDNARSTVPAEL